ncbi:nucleoside deaminase [Caldicellulosiruptoraceae bacterium PP1]
MNEMIYIYNVMERLINYVKDSDDIPVAAAVLKDKKVITIQKNSSENSIYHAEILAIIEAARILNLKDLRGCEMVVTLEPCPMCMSAIILSKIERLYFGCRDFKIGAAESIFKLPYDKSFNHKVEVIGGIMEYECCQIIKNFFKKKR